jgi:orotidine-5'-phosphate decarboxylase
LTRRQLIESIFAKKSYLCVGLDTDIRQLPAGFEHSPAAVLQFNRAIIDATAPYCVAYKINSAFYEALGEEGWKVMRQTMEYIPPGLMIIADAKRGDIGNTSALYARAFFEHLKAHAITVAPYMGEDSVRPFLAYKDKWVVLLAHTSNPGSADFQLIESKTTHRKLYEEVMLKAMTWASPEQLMFVVGATQASRIKTIRELAPDYFFLVPGVGAQGGNLDEVSNLAITRDCGLLVNASRSILYASSAADFAAAAAHAARSIQQQMAAHLQRLA